MSTLPHDIPRHFGITKRLAFVVITVSCLFQFAIWMAVVITNITSVKNVWLALAIYLFCNIIPVLYALQLLALAKRYFQGKQLSQAQLVYAKVVFVLHLIAALVYSLVIVSGLSNMAREYKMDEDGIYKYLMAVLLLLIIMDILCVVLAVRGAKFLKIAKKAYVDRLMDSFDQEEIAP
jgi:hypothetical protein